MAIYKSTFDTRGPFEGRKYRINTEKNCVEYYHNDSGKWKKAMYTVKEMEFMIGRGKMVEVNLFGKEI